MIMRNQTSNIYTEWLPLIDGLSDIDAGIIFKNILNYQNGEDIDSNNPIWIFIKSKLEEYNENGKNISKQRASAGRKGGVAKASKSKQKLANDSKPSNKRKENKTKQNKTKEIFNKPDLKQVEEYASERGYPHIAKKFYDFFEAGDWVDTKGNSVKNWKQKFITWEINDNGGKQALTGKARLLEGL